MGLQKARVLETGQSGDYWIIASCDNDFKNKAVTVRLHLYKDKAARNAGNSPTKVLEMRMDSADWDINMDPNVLDDVGVNPRKKLYPWVKANTNAQIKFDLSDATDIDPD